MSDENWMQIPGFENLYEASDLGRIRSMERISNTCRGPELTGGVILKPIFHKRTGYLVVNLTGNGARKQILVHRAILLAFKGSPPPGMEACHNNGDRIDPRLENLRWDTRKNNHADKKDHGTWQGGEACGTSKLTEDAVRHIRSSDETIADLASRFSVSRGCIEKAKYGSTWQHV